MKNQVEGLPYNIGDNVKINYRAYRCVRQSNKSLKDEFMKLAFNKRRDYNVTKKPIDFEPIFRVVRMKISSEFDNKIGVKVSLIHGRVSRWMDSFYFKKTNSTLSEALIWPAYTP